MVSPVTQAQKFYLQTLISQEFNQVAKFAPLCTHNCPDREMDHTHNKVSQLTDNIEFSQTERWDNGRLISQQTKRITYVVHPGSQRTWNEPPVRSKRVSEPVHKCTHKHTQETDPLFIQMVRKMYNFATNPYTVTTGISLLGATIAYQNSAQMKTVVDTYIVPIGTPIKQMVSDFAKAYLIQNSP